MEQTLVAPGEPAEPTPPPGRRRGRPRDPQADIRILEAAAELILERGFDSMTVDEVATRARVGKATVYRRWARKEDLAVAAMEQLYRSEMPLPDTGSIHRDLTTVYASTLAFAGSPAGRAHLRTTIAESMRDPRIALLYRAASEQMEQQATLMFQRAIARGELRPDAEVTWAVQWLSGLLASCVVMDRPTPPVESAEQLARMVLHGLVA